MATTKLKALLGDGGAGIDESHGSDRLYAVLEALITQVEDMSSKFNTHTHAADGAQAGAYNTSQPQSDTETVAQGTAVSVTALVEVE